MTGALGIPKGPIVGSDYSTWTPVDRVASRVAGKGEHYDRIVRDARRLHFKAPPKHFATGLQANVQALVGMKVGRLTVLGVLKEKGRKMKARWVVRCVCGDFELRYARAIRNPKNDGDACMDCRRTAFLRGCRP